MIFFFSRDLETSLCKEINEESQGFFVCAILASTNPDESWRHLGQQMNETWQFVLQYWPAYLLHG